MTEQSGLPRVPRRETRLQSPDPVHPVLWTLVGVIVAIEIALQASDAGLLFDNARIRVFMHGAFWGWLWDGDVSPMFEGQGYAMLLTHAFLHGGMMHLVMNMVVLLAVGKMIAHRAGARDMMILFGLSAVGGGVAFGVLSTAEEPMVGASGAVFGFLGVWKYWEYRERLLRGLPTRPVWTFIGTLAVANVVIWVVLGGYLAWEAHLGGFVAGWMGAWLLWRSMQSREIQRGDWI